jgi:hypothetical protein
VTKDEISAAIEDSRRMVTHGESSGCSPLGAALAGLAMIHGFYASHDVDVEVLIEVLRTQDVHPLFDLLLSRGRQ